MPDFFFCRVRQAHALADEAGSKPKQLSLRALRPTTDLPPFLT
jgi:hypothetical protein